MNKQLNRIMRKHVFIFIYVNGKDTVSPAHPCHLIGTGCDVLVVRHRTTGIKQASVAEKKTDCELTGQKTA